MRVSFAVQAHRERTEAAERLAALAGAEVVYDPAPEGVLRNPWRCYRLALEQTPKDATHRCIVQDDALVCSRFPETVRACVEARPRRVLVLYVGGMPHEHARAVHVAVQNDHAWAVLRNDRWLPAVAVVWPRELIPPMLEFVDAQAWPETFRSDDEILGRCMRHLGLTALATAPSLVQHPDVKPSLIGRRAMAGQDAGRVAACWIGECDPRNMDWSLGPE